MPRDYKVYLEDILEAIRRIRQYTGGLSRTALEQDTRTTDAVLRNLEIVGEAVKRLPDQIRAARTDVEWRKIAGLRDVLVHAYFDVDLDIVWDIVQNKLPTLEGQVRRILAG